MQPRQRLLGFTLVSIILFAACQNHDKVAVVKYNDENWNCPETEQELLECGTSQLEKTRQTWVTWCPFPPKFSCERGDFPPVFPDAPESEEFEEAYDDFSSRIRQYVKDNFRLKETEGLGLEGRQRIYTQFTINEAGYIEDIQVRAPHSSLESYVKELLQNLPRCKPAKRGKKPVEFRYSLPIIFDNEV